jgi:Phytanoyl-CoA dioxygenase (PhyH)
MLANFEGAIRDKGFALVSGLASDAEIEALKVTFETAEIARAIRGNQTFGARNLLRLDAVQNFITSLRLADYLRNLMGPNFRAIRGIFFDKTDKANWPVLWHQDLSLAVREQNDVAGWTTWSTKRGITHVQPPSEVLERMITVRLHLDDCPAENGALKVIPGSQRDGRLTREAITGMTSGEYEVITANAGDALFMRPLLLHGSSAAAIPTHRRVLHVEFAPHDLLPPELEWAEGA